MTEIKQNFEITQGDTGQITIEVTDELGVPKDLTGSTKRWQAFDDSGVAVIAKANSDISLVKVNGGVGELDALRFTIDPADTVSLSPKSYSHEAETIDSSSNVSTVTKGKMLVLKQLLV